MTITPTAEQEEILAAAIQAGLIGSAEEGLNVGVELLKIGDTPPSGDG
jgi:hypothetical protein